MQSQTYQAFEQDQVALPTCNPLESLASLVPVQVPTSRIRRAHRKSFWFHYQTRKSCWAREHQHPSKLDSWHEQFPCYLEPVHQRDQTELQKERWKHTFQCTKQPTAWWFVHSWVLHRFHIHRLHPPLQGEPICEPTDCRCIATNGQWNEIQDIDPLHSYSLVYAIRVLANHVVELVRHASAFGDIGYWTRAIEFRHDNIVKHAASVSNSKAPGLRVWKENRLMIKMTVETRLFVQQNDDFSYLPWFHQQ